MTDDGVTDSIGERNEQALTNSSGLVHF